MRIRDPRPEVQRLEELVKDIRSGDIRLPKFQRPFVWNRADMLNLLDSIYNGYPIGSILLWNSSERLKSERSIFDFEVGDSHELYPTNYLLDGQQRLTTLCGALYWSGKESDSIWNIRFDLETEKFVYPTKEDPIRLFPLNKLMSTSDFIRECMKFEHHPNGQLYYRNAEKLLESIKNYKIAVVKIGDVSLEEISPIFERINSTGRKLTMVDLMRAATWKGKFDLSEVISSITESIADTGFGDIQDSNILRSIAASARLGINKADIDKLRTLSAAELAVAAESAKQSIEAACTFLASRINMPDLSFLPYSLQLTHIAEFFRICPEPSPEKLTILERWFWKTSFSGYFSGANTGQNSKDLERMRAFSRGESDEILQSDPGVDLSFAFDDFNLRTASSIAFTLLLVSLKPTVGIYGEPLDVENLQELRRDMFLDVSPRGSDLHGKNIMQILSPRDHRKTNQKLQPKDLEGKLLVGPNAASFLNEGMIPEFAHARCLFVSQKLVNLTGLPLDLASDSQ